MEEASKEVEAATLKAASEAVELPKSMDTTTNPRQQSTSARSWFEGLSPEECSVAMSFRDGPFLASLLTLTAKRSRTQTPWSQSHHQRPQSLVFGALKASELDTTMAADLKEVEATLESFGKQFADGSTEVKLAEKLPETDPEPSKEEANVNKEAIEEKQQETKHDTAISTDGEKSPEHDNPDDLRIRSGHGDQSSPATKTTITTTITTSEIESKETMKTDTALVDKASAEDAEEGAAATTTPTTTSAKVDDKESQNLETAKQGTFDDQPAALKKATHMASPAVQEIADNMSVVFPSATGANGGCIPFLTLHPVYLKQRGTGDFVQMLDGVYQSISPTSSFLSSDFLPSEWLTPDDDKDLPAEESMCLRRLKSLLKDSDNNNAEQSPISLVVLLLVRIEVAVYMAFRDKDLRKDTELTNATDSPKTEDDTERRIDCNSLSKLMSEIASVESLSKSIDAAKLKDILSPLSEAGFFNVSEVPATATTESQLQNLFVTPLPVLVQSLIDLRASDRPSFETWDSAWGATLKKAREQLKGSNSNEGGVDASSNAVEAAGEPEESKPAVQPSTPEPSVKPDSEESTLSAVAQSNSSDWMDDNSPPVVTPPPSNSKKNKKKKNKRKKKKSSNTNIDSTAQSNISSNPQKDEEQTADLTAQSNTPSTPQRVEVQKAVTTAQSNTTPTDQNEQVQKADLTAQSNTPLIPQKEQVQKADSTAQSNIPSTPEKKVVQEAEPSLTDNNQISTDGVLGKERKSSEEATKAPVPSKGKISNNSEVSVGPGQLETELVNVPPAQAATPVLDGTSEAEEDRGDGIHSTSFDSEKNNMSMSDDTMSTKSESTKPEENEAGGEIKVDEDKGGFSVSRVHGVGTVVVAPSAAEEPSQTGNLNEDDDGEPNNQGDTGDDNHDWETVEVKARGNRKKGGRSGGQHNGGNAQNASKKAKSARTSASRKRVVHRKMVKEILSSVLDSVDDEVKRRQQQKARSAVSPTPSTPAWQGARTIGVAKGSNESTKGNTLRDVVVGGQAGSTQKKASQLSSKNIPSKQPASGSKKPVEKGESTSPGKRPKGQGAGADQNTASTIPETVSTDARRAQPSSSDRGITRSDCSSGGDSEDMRKQDRPSKPNSTGKDASPAPPLPTLLSPGNANSSSSSVASSLEAPHASHGHHHSSPANENDVGYHLLDVCNRLTRDMDVFMARRATALSARRRERGALLAALQESVTALWNGHSHVELYGSCATMLDLPSSDLDVVVLGLDHMEAAMAMSPPQKGMTSYSGSPGENESPEKTGADANLPHHSMPHYVPAHLNADRVVRLAAELERHPWAVHVKAIPTASVPVVKVLADPSRLPGMPQQITNEAIQQHYPVTEPTSPAAVPSATSEDPSQYPAGEPQPNLYQSDITQPIWRGADVINGLLSLDITFEGPEHGGIGSTEFSARAVQETCNETGLVAESTPFVQVIMVVKELLAQRRLNEPFSGGLSSYALLLLVLSVVCERKVIREELERVERQRREVAAGDGNSGFNGVSGDNTRKPLPQHNTEHAHSKSGVANGTAKVKPGLDQDRKGSLTQQAVGQGNKQNAPHDDKHANGSAPEAQKTSASTAGLKVSQPAATSKNNGVQQNTHQSSAETKKPSGGSWACIAKGSKSDTSASQKAKAELKPSAETQQKKNEPKKPSSFADAVARSQGKLQSQAPNATQGKSAGDANKQSKQQPVQPIAKNTQAAKKISVKNSTQNQPTAGDKGPSGSTTQRVGTTFDDGKKSETQVTRKIDADEETSKFNNYSSGVPAEPSVSGSQSLFPQGFNDVIEVLCSGETTPGKLLMHFLLFYGQHFDAHATAIDISGKHHRDVPMQNPPYTHLSPYIQRRTAGTIDPVTGMLTVDPIVVYDPLEGAEHNNVARRCFLWSSVKWVFAQSYMTLSSAVEQNTTPPTTPGAKTDANAHNQNANQGTPTTENSAWNGPYNPTDRGNLFDPSSPHPLLELLLSF